MNVKKVKIKNRIINVFNKTLEIILSIIFVYLLILSLGIRYIFFDSEEQEEHNIWTLMENEKRIIKKK